MRVSKKLYATISHRHTTPNTRMHKGDGIINQMESQREQLVRASEQVRAEKGELRITWVS